MNWAIAIPALTFIGEGMLLGLVIRGAWRSPIGRSLALYLGAMAMASFSSWMMHADLWPGPTIWFRLIIASGVLQAALVVRFAVLFTHLGPGWVRTLTLWLWYLVATILFVLNTLGYVAQEAHVVPGEQGVIEVHFGAAGYFMFISILLNMLCVAALYIHSYRIAADGVRRRAVLYPLGGGALVVLGGFTNASSSLSRYPIDQLFYLGNATLLSYAILRHRMLELGSILRRGAVYSLLTVFITALFLMVALFSGQRLLGNLPGYVDWVGLVVVALIVAMIYRPLWERLQRMVDRVFFRERYDYAPTLEEFTRKVSTLLDLDELARAVVQMIVETMQLDIGALFARERAEGDLRLLAARALDGESPQVAGVVERKTALAWFSEADKQPFLMREKADGQRMIFGDRRFQLGLPLWVKGELVGFLLLGNRLSGEAYSEEDLLLLSTFANQIGATLENARLFREMEVLEREHRRLVEDMNEGYVLFQDLTIRFSNEKFAQMLGYSVEEIIGRPFSQFFLAEYAEQAVRYSQLMRELKSVPSQVEGIAVKKDGTKIRIEASIRVIEYEGQPAVTGIVRDVTEREMVEQRLRQSEKLAALGQLAAGVAHDINNTLGAVLARSELCQRLLGRPQIDVEKIGQQLRVIQQAVQDGAETVRRLRQFASPRASSEGFMEVGLGELIKEAIELTSYRWQGEAQARGATIGVVTDLKDVPPVRGNPAHLKELLANLILNAVDVMPQGGTLTLCAWQEGGMAFISVSDTGRGMTEEEKQRCFEPFYTTKGPANSGLGLALCYSIVREHQGEITVESVLGKGTTFTIGLPLVSGQVPVLHAMEASSLRPLRILLADDEEGVREALVGLLEQAGHQVQAAGGGEEALEMLGRSEFDVLITDLAMPGMGGMELAELAKKHYPNMPVVLLTGWEQLAEGPGQECTDGLIFKPIGLEQIEETLGRVLAQKSPPSENIAGSSS